MLSGDMLSDTLQGLVIRFNRCNETEMGCADEDTISSSVNASIATVVIKSSYFDFNNIEEPIQTKYDVYYEIIFPNFVSQHFYHISRNEYTLRDSVFDFGASETGVFYSAERYNQQLTESDSLINVTGFMFFHLDPKIEQYERSVLTFLEAIGIVGGIYEFIYGFFAIVCPLFMTSMYYSEIINKLSSKMTNKVHELARIKLSYPLQTSKRVNTRKSKKPSANDVKAMWQELKSIDGAKTDAQFEPTN